MNGAELADQRLSRGAEGQTHASVPSAHSRHNLPTSVPRERWRNRLGADSSPEWIGQSASWPADASPQTGQTAVDGLHAPDGTLRSYSTGKTLARIAD